MKRWFHETERAPGGIAGLATPVYLSRGKSIDDCLTLLRGTRGLTIWEPIATKAPGPHLTAVWCCYISHVIFYVFPFVPRGPHPVKSPSAGWYWEPDGRSYTAWDSVDSRLTFNDLVSVGGLEYEVTGGGVRWAGGRWWWYHRCELKERGLRAGSTPLQPAPAGAG